MVALHLQLYNEYKTKQNKNVNLNGQTGYLGTGWENTYKLLSSKVSNLQLLVSKISLFWNFY